MPQATKEQYAEPFYAQTYDHSVPDWPSEIDFYQRLAGKVKAVGGTVLDAAGRVDRRVALRPVRLPCVFRFEMEHLLACAGYENAVVYGGFDRQALQDDGRDIVWTAGRP